MSRVNHDKVSAKAQEAIKPPLSNEGSQTRYGKEILPGITVLTGYDLKPLQTHFEIPELADPYVSLMKDSVIISGTAQYYLKFRSIDDIRRGGPYQVIWNDFYYPDGTSMEGEHYFAHSWDMKPSFWASSPKSSPRLWDPEKDTTPPIVVWYGGHMRPRTGEKISHWPEDNFSRDVFPFVEKESGKWFSLQNSIFSLSKTWPRALGNFLGHRYGHQIVMVPKMGLRKTVQQVPAVFYEEVTEVHRDGSPAVTKIFMNEMLNPFQAGRNPIELISPINPTTGNPYPSTVRENGSVLVEGPLYFRFLFKGEQWEAIGFSAGSFYGKYPACFASRKVSEGLRGKPFILDLNEDGSDLHDAGHELLQTLNLTGGPGRPSVIVKSNGMAIPGPENTLQVLVHAYRRDIHPINDRLSQMFRIIIHAYLKIEMGPRDGLHFQIMVPQGQKPNWGPNTFLR